MYTLKKSLGQHFLIDESVSERIMAAIQQEKFTQLLEIGPGGGALTKHLLQLKNVDLKTVEIDREKVDHLLKAYPQLKGKIIPGDFLEMDIPFQRSFMITGNFPYYISSQILFRILDWKQSVQGMVGMFQKEVALRVASKEGNKVYGVTSVLVQAFYDVQYLFDVNEKSFQPAPKVKSGVIKLSPRKEVPPMRSESDLFLLVKTAFNQRRKTLRNAVRSLFDAAKLENKLFDKRAEQLSVEELAQLTFSMK